MSGPYASSNAPGPRGGPGLPTRHADGPPAPQPPRRSPLLGIAALVLAWLSGAALYWASADSSGELIAMLGEHSGQYNTVRAVMLGGLLLGTSLGIVAMVTRRGRWWGLAALIVGGLQLIALVIVVLLVFGLFGIIQLVG